MPVSADSEELIEAIRVLRDGGIIAYPTESVYGLGCDPFNGSAVQRLLTLKKRSVDKGFILIAASWAPFDTLVEPIKPELIENAQVTWPGPVTWAFPSSEEVPDWVRGAHRTVALRITDHPIAKSICEYYGGAIISSSANVEGSPPARDAESVKLMFGDEIDSVVTGDVGGLSKPTEIRDAITGEILRSA